MFSYVYRLFHHRKTLAKTQKCESVARGSQTSLSRDHWLPGRISLDAADGVRRRDLFDRESCEQRPDLRHVVDRHDKAAFERVELLGHQRELLSDERLPPVLALWRSVGRIEVKELLRPVVAGDEIGSREVLNDDAGEAFVDVFDRWCQAGEIEACVVVRHRAETAAGHLATKGEALEIEKARCAPDRSASRGRGPSAVQTPYGW